MKTEVNVARIKLIGAIIAVIGTIIVALININISQKPDKPPIDAGVPREPGGTNTVRKINIEAGHDVIYSEKDVVINAKRAKIIHHSNHE